MRIDFEDQDENKQRKTKLELVELNFLMTYSNEYLVVAIGINADPSKHDKNDEHMLQHDEYNSSGDC